MEKSFSFRDLEIWQIAMQLAASVYEVTSSFPLEERFGLTSQIRRAAVSIAANISEGWGRGTQANLANFVRISRGSLSELETLMELANRLGYLSGEAYKAFELQADVLGRKSYAFLGKVDKHVVREELAAYVAD